MRLNIKKKKRSFVVGSRVEEKEGHNDRNRLGEICGIIDGRRGKVFELIMLNPHNLTPVIVGKLGAYRRFKLHEDRCKPLNEKKYLGKRTFRIGDVVRKSYGDFSRYSIIVNFVHPDGLMSNSHHDGYNGRDLLECIEISPRPGLQRLRDNEGKLKRFTMTSNNCKICKIKPMDNKGGMRLKNSAP